MTLCRLSLLSNRLMLVARFAIVAVVIVVVVVHRLLLVARFAVVVSVAHLFFLAAAGDRAQLGRWERGEGRMERGWATDAHE